MAIASEIILQPVFLTHRALLLVVVSFCANWPASSHAEEKVTHQYEYNTISIPAASAGEPKLSRFSLELAAEYIENGNVAWWKTRKCIACHTTGVYLSTRPALTPHLGKPSSESRDLSIDFLRKLQGKTEPRDFEGTQIAAVAAGLPSGMLTSRESFRPKPKRRCG